MVCILTLSFYNIWRCALNYSEVVCVVMKNRLAAVVSTSREIRTLVLTLKGLRPGPLDDGGTLIKLFYSLAPPERFELSF